ncbi:hypothetical protein C9I57_10745 [Trinickia symbiotica]|uniref:Uncharacterized protein n=1 Tax=Trinickia symbiotica TaxID=863227 RepID=A0A2T3XXC6_9BURK|nr:hypothetical protein [Trinickia symbiotica]PTB21167.1 hypothetical protein C9I57_10745 [Trinickia symbiotica]
MNSKLEYSRRLEATTLWARANVRLDTVGKRHPIGVFLVLLVSFALLLFLHNPGKLLTAEFWGEDGAVWYADAYNNGISSFFITNGGYLNSVQRLIAFLTLPLPLHLAPIFFAFIALLVQVLPPAFLATSRMAEVWPDTTSRYLFAIFLVAMPNAQETSVNVTDSQWHLAILAFLLIISSPPRSTSIRLVEYLVLLVSGLSGPFGILFGPIAVLQLWRSVRAETKVRLVRLLIIGLTGLVQGLLIIGLSHSGRISGPLGASMDLLPRIVSMVPLGGTFGYGAVSEFARLGFFDRVWPSLCVLALTAPLMFGAFLWGESAYRQFFCFTLAMFALALSKPLMSHTEPQWPLFIHAVGAGNRYFLYPMIAWWSGLIVVIARGPGWLRYLAALPLVLAATLAVPRDWGEQYHFARTDFVNRARNFEVAPIGTQMHFLTHPPGTQMVLVKK